MKRIYALFSNTDGYGFESTFICTVNEDELKFVDAQIGNITINKTRFKVGYCDIPENQYNDVDTREWFVSDMAHKGITLVAKNYPIFDQKK